MNASVPMKRSTGRSADGAATSAIGYEIVVVGTSWGGLDAMRTLLDGLPSEYEMPMILVQHRSRDSDALLARILQERTRLRVCEVEDKQPVDAGAVYIAPANYHTLVEEGHFSLSTEAPVRYSRPSIDVTMMSAAATYGHRTVGVILTGSNNDGSAGLRRVVDAGGMGVIQDPATAVAIQMPAAALQSVPTARVFRLERLATFLGTLPFARTGHRHA
jgi:two-component system, chemotaxis family, protein-glutamate methylesterase/glutaminase